MSSLFRVVCSTVSPAMISIMVCFASAGAAPVSAWETAPVDAPIPGSIVETVLPSSGESVTESVTWVEVDNPFAPPYQSGWPQIMGTHPNFKPSGIVLADLDGDDTLEVIAGSTDNEFRVWRYDGTLMSGWPVNLGGAIQAKAAVADLDGDGDLEIIISVKSGYIHVLHHDGTPMSGWPKPSGVTGGFRAPTIYDLDGDNVPEIMIGSPTNVRVWHADGSIMSGFPQPVGGNITATLAVGDITGDGVPEIFAEALDGKLYSFQIDGTVTPGDWPATFGLSNSYAAPSIGDLDGDGLCEVLVAGYQLMTVTQVHAYNGDGSVALDFPISVPGYCGPNSPEVGDIDRDGDLEIAFTMGSGHVAVWDFPIDYSEPIDGWGALFHDDWNTSW